MPIFSSDFWNPLSKLKQKIASMQWPPDFEKSVNCLQISARFYFSGYKHSNFDVTVKFRRSFSSEDRIENNPMEWLQSR